MTTDGLNNLTSFIWVELPPDKSIWNTGTKLHLQAHAASTVTLQKLSPTVIYEARVHHQNHRISSLFTDVKFVLFTSVSKPDTVLNPARKWRHYLCCAPRSATYRPGVRSERHRRIWRPCEPSTPSCPLRDSSWPMMNPCLRGSEAGERSGIFLQATDITKNKFMRNLTHTATSLHGEIDWEKIWLLGDEFHPNKKVKEVSFKIMQKKYIQQSQL